MADLDFLFSITLFETILLSILVIVFDVEYIFVVIGIIFEQEFKSVLYFAPIILSTLLIEISGSFVFNVEDIFVVIGIIFEEQSLLYFISIILLTSINILNISSSGAELFNI